MDAKRPEVRGDRVVAAAVMGLVVMSLWNWLAPAVFGARTITFWQALALLILSWLLLGGFRGGLGRHMHWRGRMRERWEQMTPEEREKFRKGMRHRCGGREMPDAAPPAA